MRMDMDGIISCAYPINSAIRSIPFISWARLWRGGGGLDAAAAALAASAAAFAS